MSDVQIEIDGDTCIGAGQCEALAPDHVLLDDDGIARPVGNRVPLALAEELVRACPSGALKIAAEG